MTEAKEQFGKMLRWTAQPTSAEQGEKTIFMGETIQGYYVGKRDKVGQNESSVYEIMLPSGEKVSFWGSGLLDGKFAEIPLNCEVRVTYLGTAQPKTPKGRAYQNFKVEFDKDSKKPMALAGQSTPTAPASAAAGQVTPPPAQSNQGF